MGTHKWGHNRGRKWGRFVFNILKNLRNLLQCPSMYTRPVHNREVARCARVGQEPRLVGGHGHKVHVQVPNIGYGVKVCEVHMALSAGPGTQEPHDAAKLLRGKMDDGTTHVAQDSTAVVGKRELVSARYDGDHPDGPLSRRSGAVLRTWAKEDCTTTCRALWCSAGEFPWLAMV